MVSPTWPWRKNVVKSFLIKTLASLSNWSDRFVAFRLELQYKSNSSEASVVMTGFMVFQSLRTAFVGANASWPAFKVANESWAAFGSANVSWNVFKSLVSSLLLTYTLDFKIIKRQKLEQHICFLLSCVLVRQRFAGGLESLLSMSDSSRIWTPDNSCLEVIILSREFEYVSDFNLLFFFLFFNITNVYFYFELRTSSTELLLRQFF